MNKTEAKAAISTVIDVLNQTGVEFNGISVRLLEKEQDSYGIHINLPSPPVVDIQSLLPGIPLAFRVVGEIKAQKFNLESIIGKRVVAIKGSRRSTDWYKRGKVVPEFILFDDSETYLLLTEQDPYSYCDFSRSARELEVWQDATNYKEFLSLPDADTDL